MRVDINFVKKYTSIKYKSIKYISLIKHERVRTYVMVFQFSTKISAVDLRLSLKNRCSYFRVLMNSDRAYIYVVGCLDACTVVACRAQRGRTYTSLARKGLSKQDVFLVLHPIIKAARLNFILY